MAFSAGADSAALLVALHELQARFGYRLVACHINHGLRTASQHEERQAISFCNKLGISLETRNVLVKQSGNIEENARLARYKMLMEAANEQNADCIALGHHAGDQAETMLMHLLSGCGPDGLSGMREWAKPYWRPLLQTPKAVLINYLEERGLSWVEDESNSDIRYTRNFLRHKVMPLLEEVQPSAQVLMARAAHILDAENDTWERMVSDWLMLNGKDEPPFHFILLSQFKEQEPSFQRRLLRKICERRGIRLNFEQTEALRAFSSENGPQKLNLPEHASAYRSSERLHILPDAVKLTLFPWPQPGSGIAGDDFKPGRHRQVVDAKAISGASLRWQKPGDMIQPLGTKGSQPIMKYLSARKVDRPFKPYWPVYARGSEVLWVPGHGISESVAVRESTKETVELLFAGKLPDEI